MLSLLIHAHSLCYHAHFLSLSLSLDMDMKSLRESQIILSDPYNWDRMSRRWCVYMHIIRMYVHVFTCVYV